MRNLIAPILLSTVFLTACSSDKESMSLYLAKEMCSCRFLIGQDDKNCRDTVRVALAVGDISVNEAKREVTATAEDKSHPATFRFVSKRFGCELKPD